MRTMDCKNNLIQNSDIISHFYSYILIYNDLKYSNFWIYKPMAFGPQTLDAWTMREINLFCFKVSSVQVQSTSWKLEAQKKNPRSVRSKYTMYVVYT